tara:strand:+ start:69 stop:332 length:264 start_codon:yes stop_codon:yes gene_type:complete
MHNIDQMRQLRVLAVCEASLFIIKKIKAGEAITYEEKFAITDSHKVMFDYTSDLIQENKLLKEKLSKIRYHFNKMSLEYKTLLLDDN